MYAVSPHEFYAKAGVDLAPEAPPAVDIQAHGGLNRDQGRVFAGPSQGWPGSYCTVLQKGRCNSIRKAGMASGVLETPVAASAVSGDLFYDSFLYQKHVCQSKFVVRVEHSIGCPMKDVRHVRRPLNSSAHRKYHPWFFEDTIIAQFKL